MNQNKYFFTAYIFLIFSKYWNNSNVRSIIYQFIALIFIVFTTCFISNALYNLSIHGILKGFNFLTEEAGFDIGEILINYNADNTYFRAILVGLFNTLYIAVIGIMLSTFLGILIGISRFSKNWLINKISIIYVEIIRNVPLLLQLFFWYALIIENTPHPCNAINLFPGIFISNRGLDIPRIEFNYLYSERTNSILIFSFVFILISWIYNRFFIIKNRKFPSIRIIVAIIIIYYLMMYLFGYINIIFHFPKMDRFNFHDSLTLTPEFLALSIGLVFHTSAFLSEVIRSGINSVGKGQWEAANSLGLKRWQVIRLVIFPQALKVIMPPIIGQYLNLTKNSSLAVAIGYPDIVSIVSVIINQTGLAIEGVIIILAVYLSISLLISIFINWYNRRLILIKY